MFVALGNGAAVETPDFINKHKLLKVEVDKTWGYIKQDIHTKGTYYYGSDGNTYVNIY